MSPTQPQSPLDLLYTLPLPVFAHYAPRKHAPRYTVKVISRAYPYDKYAPVWCQSEQNAACFLVKLEHLTPLCTACEEQPAVHISALLDDTLLCAACLDGEADLIAQGFFDDLPDWHMEEA